MREFKGPCESMLKSIIDIQTEMILRHKPDTTITFANPAFINFAGIKAINLIGKKWIDIVPPKYSRIFLDAMGSSMPGNNNQQIDLEIYWPGIGNRWISYITTAIFDENGQKTEYQVVGRDVTLSKKLQSDLENALEENKRLKEKYTTIADYTHDMERWVSPDLELLYISPSCERMTGYTREDFMQKGDLLGKIMLPEDRKDWVNRFKDYYM
jgi:PAS domain S-box-containing protein